MVDTNLDTDFVPADQLPPDHGVHGPDDHDEAEDDYHNAKHQGPRPAAPPPVREVDKIARAMLIGVHDLMEFDGVKIPLDSRDYTAINQSAWIEARYRGIPLPGIPHRSVNPTRTSEPSQPAQAPAPSGGLDYDKPGPPSQKARNLYNLCIERAEKHVMQSQDVMMSKARQTIRKFCATEYEDRYKQVIPTDSKLEAGPMSYLIDRLKDTYPLDLNIDKGGA